jgi:hypothetical protein
MFFGFAPLSGAPFSGQPQAPATIQPDPRYARPLSDAGAGPWTSSDGGSLADAVKQDDGITMNANAPGTCEIKLGPVVDPQTSYGQVVRYKAGSSAGSGLTVRLKQGTTVIAAWAHTSLPAAQTVFTQVLTSAQCDSITDYTNLRFEFEAL